MATHCHTRVKPPQPQVQTLPLSRTMNSTAYLIATARTVPPTALPLTPKQTRSMMVPPSPPTRSAPTRTTTHSAARVTPTLAPTALIALTLPQVAGDPHSTAASPVQAMPQADLTRPRAPTAAVSSATTPRVTPAPQANPQTLRARAATTLRAASLGIRLRTTASYLVGTCRAKARACSTTCMTKTAS